MTFPVVHMLPLSQYGIGTLHDIIYHVLTVNIFSSFMFSASLFLMPYWLLVWGLRTHSIRLFAMHSKNLELYGFV